MLEKIASLKMWACITVACGLTMTLLGCSSVKPPVDIIARADATLTRAIDAKAAEFAPLELHLAREELDAAKKAMTKEDYEKARRLAEQALADAQLAEAKADSESARRTAQEVQATIDQLRREAEQKATAKSRAEQP